MAKPPQRPDLPRTRPLTKQERTALIMSMAPVYELFDQLTLTQEQQEALDTPEMIDLAIGVWRKQPAASRIGEDDLLHAAGFLLGDRLRHEYDIEWAFIEDDYGAFVGLAHGPSDRVDILVIDPVNSMAKRMEAGGPTPAQELFNGLAGHLEHLPRTGPAQPLQP